MKVGAVAGDGGFRGRVTSVRRQHIEARFVGMALDLSAQAVDQIEPLLRTGSPSTVHVACGVELHVVAGRDGFAQLPAAGALKVQTSVEGRTYTFGESGAGRSAEALLDTISTALGGSGLPPSRLELEITETQIIKDITKTQWLLAQCRAIGVRIAIDDFGTGYSSLLYLKRLPIDRLKIDQSFVRDLVASPDDRTIAASVAALGHSLGLKVIAEGVETAEQLKILQTMHCDEGQGYLWSKPMSADEFAAKFAQIQGAPMLGRAHARQELQSFVADATGEFGAFC